MSKGHRTQEFLWPRPLYKVIVLQQKTSQDSAIPQRTSNMSGASLEGAPSDLVSSPHSIRGVVDHTLSVLRRSGADQNPAIAEDSQIAGCVWA